MLTMAPLRVSAPAAKMSIEPPRTRVRPWLFISVVTLSTETVCPVKVSEEGWDAVLRDPATIPRGT